MGGLGHSWGARGFVPPPRGADSTSALTLGPGATDLSQDFGDLGSGGIGYLVFRDDNGNDVGDTGEGIPGVSVEVTWSGPNGSLGDGDDHT